MLRDHGTARIAIVILPLVWTSLWAQDIQPQDLAGRLDLTVPESPAFVVLGVTPKNVLRPSTGRDLAFALLNGFDANGNVQAGLAIDAKPYLLARGPNITLADYRLDWTTRQLSRIQASVATTAGQSDSDKADQVALGLKWTPWDEGDPRLDWNPDNEMDGDTLEGCFREKLAISDEPPATIEEIDEMPDTDAALAKSAKACVAQSERRNWNANAWDIGVAGFRSNAEGQKAHGYSVWSSISLGVGRRGQFIGHLRMLQDQQVPDDQVKGDYFKQDSWIVGSRFPHGWSTRRADAGGKLFGRRLRWPGWRQLFPCFGRHRVQNLP